MSKCLTRSLQPGVWHDVYSLVSDMTPVVSACRSAYFGFRRVNSIGPFLTENVTAALCSRVLSRIDDRNSLLAGITSEQLVRLQRKQNNSDWLIFRQKRSHHC